MLAKLRYSALALVVSLMAFGTARAQTEPSYQAFLTGDQEVPSNDSLALGRATFQLSQDKSALQYRLVVANLNDVSMAHIHIGGPDESGPVTVWLYPASPPPQPKPGAFSGVLAEGTITADNLIGPLQGQPLSALLAKIEAGQAYVNAHTAAHPAGEIRGQIFGGQPGGAAAQAASDGQMESGEMAGEEEPARTLQLGGLTYNDHGTVDVRGMTSLEVEADSSYFEPTFLRGDPGQSLKLTIHNESNALHNFSLSAQGIDQDLPAGQTVEVSLMFPASGVQQFDCKYHTGLGMNGELLVGDAQPQ